MHDVGFYNSKNSKNNSTPDGNVSRYKTNPCISRKYCSFFTSKAPEFKPGLTVTAQTACKNQC